MAGWGRGEKARKGQGRVWWGRAGWGGVGWGDFGSGGEGLSGAVRGGGRTGQGRGWGQPGWGGVRKGGVEQGGLGQQGAGWCCERCDSNGNWRGHRKSRESKPKRESYVGFRVYFCRVHASRVSTPTIRRRCDIIH